MTPDQLWNRHHFSGVWRYAYVGDVSGKGQGTVTHEPFHQEGERVLPQGSHSHLHVQLIIPCDGFEEFERHGAYRWRYLGHQVSESRRTQPLVKSSKNRFHCEVREPWRIHHPCRIAITEEYGPSDIDCIRHCCFLMSLG